MKIIASKTRNVKKYVNNLKYITMKPSFVGIKTVMIYYQYGMIRLKSVKDALKRLQCITVVKNNAHNVLNKNHFGT